MQKKLMAVAVAGALAIPAIAAAQSSVTISGHARVEYGRADLGDQRGTVDGFDTPGSNVRFSGTEALGGGMSAWFQCESSADIRGHDQTGFCTRNSAVGLRGGFGNLYFGRWDTPFKRVMNHGTVGGEETGILGMSFLAFGGSGGANTVPNGENSVDVFGESMQRQRFKRRESCLTTYDSPNFGGFQIMGAFTCSHTQQVSVDSNANLITNASSNKKPRTWSLGGQYVNGPLAIGVGYEQHEQFGSQIPGSPNLDDAGWGLGISYGFFNGNVLVGLNYLRREFEVAAGSEIKKDTWTIGVDWRLAGPHQIQVQYVWADDTKGSAPAGFTGLGGNAGIPWSPITGGDSTEQQSFSIAYQYHLSKRTRAKIGYIWHDNDSNVAANRSVRVGNTPALLGSAGQSVDGWAFILRHDF